MSLLGKYIELPVPHRMKNKIFKTLKANFKWCPILVKQLSWTLKSSGVSNRPFPCEPSGLIKNRLVDRTGPEQWLEASSL